MTGRIERFISVKLLMRKNTLFLHRHTAPSTAYLQIIPTSTICNHLAVKAIFGNPYWFPTSITNEPF
ncbi:MAG: hypothetical protein R2795_08165 [Saprospiraceae bacterium]